MSDADCPTCLMPPEAQPGRVSDMDNGIVSMPCPTCTERKADPEARPTGLELGRKAKEAAQ